MSDLVERLRGLLERRKSTGIAVPQTQAGGWKLYENEAALYELRDLAPELAQHYIEAADRISLLTEFARVAEAWFAGYVANGGKGADEELAKARTVLGACEVDAPRDPA